MAHFVVRVLVPMMLVVLVGVGEATPPRIAKNPSHATCRIKKYKHCYNLVHVCPKFCPDQCTVECASCKPICVGASNPPPSDSPTPSTPDHNPPPSSPIPSTPDHNPPPSSPTPSTPEHNPPPSSPSPSTPENPTPSSPTPSKPENPPPSSPTPTPDHNPPPSSPTPENPPPSSPTPTPDHNPPPSSPTPSTPENPPPSSPTPSTPDHNPPPSSPTPSTPENPPPSSPTPSTPDQNPPPSSPSTPKNPPPSSPTTPSTPERPSSSSPPPSSSTPDQNPPPSSPSTPKNPPTSSPTTPSTPERPPSSSPPPSSPTPSTPENPPPSSSTPSPSTPSPTPKTARCRNKYYPKCYNMEHVCPSPCPTGCEVDCVTCKPVCKCDRPGAVCQDPRFIGGDGVTFYFHGKKDSNFCLVSEPNLHINAHFIGRRNPTMTRDFTWVQSLAILFHNHRIFVGALETGKWDDSVDRLSLIFDGKPITLHQQEDAAWNSITTPRVIISRAADANSVIIEVLGRLRITAKVVPITEEDSRIHNYGITNEDCFAHLDLGFKFFSLSNEVSGVLGQTYRPDYVSNVDIKAKMPIMGGEKRFETTSLFAPDCSVARFVGNDNGFEFNSGAAIEGLELPSLSCASGMDGLGVVCKR